MSLGKRISVVTLVLAVSLMFSGGCKNLQGPNWFHPGPAEVQQAQATDYDPYPQVDAGPRLDGTRPQGYDRPPAEVLTVQPEATSQGSRWSSWRWPWQ